MTTSQTGLLLKFLKLSFLMKESDETFRRDHVYQSVETVIILRDFHSGILKLFEGNFHQGIKRHIIIFTFV